MADAHRTRIWMNGRSFLRVPFSTTVEYFYGAGATGTGQCRDLSRNGLSMSLGRYLTPGRKILVRVFSIANPVEAAELKGRIVWCRPTEQPERFLAGVEIFYDMPEVSEDLSRLMFEAALAHTGAASTASAAESPGRADMTCFRMQFSADALACAGFVKPLAFAAAVHSVNGGA